MTIKPRAPYFCCISMSQGIDVAGITMPEIVEDDFALIAAQRDVLTFEIFKGDVGGRGALTDSQRLVPIWLWL